MREGKEGGGRRREKDLLELCEMDILVAKQQHRIHVGKCTCICVCGIGSHTHTHTHHTHGATHTYCALCSSKVCPLSPQVWMEGSVVLKYSLAAVNTDMHEWIWRPPFIHRLKAWTITTHTHSHSKPTPISLYDVMEYHWERIFIQLHATEERERATYITWEYSSLSILSLIMYSICTCTRTCICT